MYERKPNLRREFRQEARQRVEDSATLAETFRDLKSLTLNLAYFRPGSFTRDSEIKYTVNLANAKSLFRFSCPNERCVGGDFDLSRVLSQAVAARQTSLTGEAICQGWCDQTNTGQVHCRHILRYRLSAEYALDSRPDEPEQTRASAGNED